MKMRLSWRKHYYKFQSAGFFQYSPKERTSIRVFLRMCVPFSCIPNKDGSLRRFETILHTKNGVTAFELLPVKWTVK